jgi:acetyltransferase-like isoleucine patch superfamily enzyme
MIEQFLQLIESVRRRTFTSLVASGFGSFGPGSRVCPPFRFYNLKRMHLGDDVTIHRDCWLVALGEGDGINPLIRIGSGTKIGQGSTISAAENCWAVSGGT